MSSQRYERVAAHDEDDDSPITPTNRNQPIPNSPPPSFHSRASSPVGASRRLLHSDPARNSQDADTTLEDTFDGPSDDEDDEDGDDRQRLMRAQPDADTAQGREDRRSEEVRPRPIERRVTQLPVFQPATASGRVYGGGNMDGVFANLSAKPSVGDHEEEKPPSYEQAAADATPPYWETTILAPGIHSDDVFIDGLPVGSVFSFIWNGLISMSFQLVGFLLTYLLHTTHAAKNGSKAGLGITLIQYGFSFKSVIDDGGSPADGNGPPTYNPAPPSDPNNHNFPAGDAAGGAAAAAAAAQAAQAAQDSGFTANDIIAYLLMVAGWFLLIKAISNFLRARRHEQLVLQSPDRGLGTAVVAEGERPESSV